MAEPTHPPGRPGAEHPGQRSVWLATIREAAELARAGSLQEAQDKAGRVVNDPAAPYDIRLQAERVALLAKAMLVVRMVKQSKGGVE